MIKIIAKALVPEKNQEAFTALAKPLVAASQNEEGNIAYNLHRSLSDPEELVFLEIWKDQAAIDAHNASPHFTTVLPKLMALCSTEMTITLYEIVL